MQKKKENLDDIQNFKKKFSDMRGAWDKRWEHVRDDLKFESGKQFKPDEEDAGNNIIKNLVRKYVNRLVNPSIYHSYGVSLEAKDEQYEPVEPVLVDAIDEIIQSDSDREAIEVAYRSAVTSGYGACKIDVYTNRRGNKSIRLKPIYDVTSVYPGRYENIDGSDMECCIVVNWVDKKKAQKEYDVDIDNLYNEGSVYEGWNDKETKDCVPEVIFYNLENEKYQVFVVGGEEYSKDEFDALVMEQANVVDMLGSTQEVVADEIREVQEKVVSIRRYIGDHLVEKAKLDIPYIPLILFQGEVDYTDDDIGRSGIVKLLRDTQKLVNFYASREADIAAQSVLGMWIIDERLPLNIKQQYQNSILKNVGYVDQPFEIDGIPVKDSQYVEKRIDPSTYVMSREKAEMDSEGITGINAVSFGDAGSGMDSGYAVFLKQTQAEIATIHYQSNMEKSLKHIIKILIELIVAMDDTEVEFTDEETKETTVIPLNSLDLYCDDFNIGLTQGPINATKKQQAMLQAMQVAEQIGFNLVGDIVLENSDIPQKERYADRIYKSLPPELQDREEDDEQAIDPEAQAALDTAQAALQEKEMVVSELSRYVEMLQDALNREKEDRANDMAMKAIDASKDLAKNEANELNDMVKNLITAREKGVELPEGMATYMQSIFDNARAKVDEIVGVRKEEEIIADEDVIMPEQQMEEMIEEPEMEPELPEMPPMVEGPIQPRDAGNEVVDEITFEE